MLPPDHAQRTALNDEVHARPPEQLTAPARVSFLALLADGALRERVWRSVIDLAERFDAAPPAPGANHYSRDLGTFRFTAERHTEFVRFNFIVAGVGADPFLDPAIAAVPAEWVAALPGRVMVATHVALLPEQQPPLEQRDTAARFFSGNMLVGASIAGGAGFALTDFRIHADGFGRLLVEDRGMTPGQAGRAVQRLLEIDTYRMMALLALPLAREVAPVLTGIERELAGITGALVSAGEQEEPGLLERLTRLAAEIESRQSETLFRFGAASAYYDLVQRRTVELREERIQGLQTFREFIERRLAPAMNTCRSVAGRQDALSVRVARATQLLSTRVNLTRERQNQALLASMDRRAQLQLRLQETVEGLSVAAITYYVVSLVGHAAEALEAAGVHVSPAMAMGVAIPVVAILVAFGVRRLRRVVSRAHG